MKILVTGATGFIGKNLVLWLSEQPNIEVLTFVRGQDDATLSNALAKADLVFHLAGENRPIDLGQFYEVNTGLTKQLCRVLCILGKKIPVIFSSSIQAEQDNHYGKSKLEAEKALIELSQSNGNSVAIYRLPGVFGKWCRPYYNSVVATFCYSKAFDLPIQIDNPNSVLQLVHIDDVIRSFMSHLQQINFGLIRPSIFPTYSISVGELSDQLEYYRIHRSSLMLNSVGSGLSRALYSTFMSYLPVEKFSYCVPTYTDSRGTFGEMLKIENSGQFSFFTAHPGMTRGGHYHHSKTEKFLVVKGHARFRFRNLLSDEIYHLESSDIKPQIVDSIPGWVHDITNIGASQLIVMLWANEVFDKINPDTFKCDLHD